MSQGRIHFAVEDDVAQITLDHAETRNALTREMVDALRHRFEEAQGQARAVHLKGANGVFCAGANLAEDDGMSGPDADGGRILLDHYNPLMRTIRGLDIPIVISLEGPVVGVGASIALSCDLIFAAPSAFLMLPFARIGLIPDGGVAHTLVRAVGRARATKIMLTSERISATQALDWGLVTQISEDGAVGDEAADAARALAAGPTAALGAIRKLAWTALDHDFDAQLATEVVVQRALAVRGDYREGVSAFIEKRRPVFDGR